MAVLGRGEANGGISVLHALGCGYGCSIGIDLTTRLQLRDSPVKSDPDDDKGVLPATVAAWEAAGLPMPEAEELHWAVRSDIPKGRGLKSSAALSVAAIRALMDAAEVELESHQIVDIARDAQIAAGVSFTGSVDDAWAAVEPGYKVVNPGVPAAEGILVAGDVPDAEKWTILIIDRGPRENQPDPERFQATAAHFQQAIKAIELGQLFNAMIQNGRAVATALNDSAGRKVCNDVGIWGCRAASISGSGPAIATLVPEGMEATVKRVHQMLEPRGWNIIETRFRTA